MSDYNEVVIRTTIESKNITYYTDDSMKSIRRHIYTQEEASELGYDYSDDYSMIGLNGYPCNSGLITHDQLQNISLGMAFSHPVLCNLINE